MRRFIERHAIDTRPLVVPAYRRLFISQGTSTTGAMVTEVAVSVQVYALTRSSFYVGLVGFAGLVPIAVFGLYGGAIADVFDRRAVFLWSSLLCWSATLALLAQTLLHVGSVWLILGLVAVQAGALAVADSARGAMIPRLVEPRLVPSANTLNITLYSSAAVIGPLVAGVFVTRRNGFAWAYGTDAALFTVALAHMVRLPPIPLVSPGSIRIGMRAVGEGLAFIVAQPVLFMSFLVDIVANVLALPRAVFPAVAAARFNGEVGPLYAAVAIGAVLAGLGGGWIGRVHRQGRALILAVVGWGTAVALAGLMHQLWLAVALLAVAGAADMVSATYRQTILQTYAPDEMRGRMQGAFIAVVTGGPRLGDLRAGGMAAITSPSASWVGGGVACVVVVVAAGALVRSFWRYDSGAGAGR